ncbi:MAG: MFS transporter [Spirochaetes bacterium]|nr:MFS transporter [Spirochaetota bacterium]
MSRSRRVIFTLFISIISFLFFYRNTDSFYLNPFKTEFSQVNPSAAVADSFNNLYVIDNSQRRFFKCSSSGVLDFAVHGGLKEPNHFFYAEDIAADDEGFVYIINRVTDNGGFFTEKEEVLCYDPSGKFHSVIFSKTHTEKKQILVQKGQLSRLEFNSGKLSWFDISEKGIDYYVYERNGKPHVEKSFDYPLAATFIADISLRGVNLYFTNKNGKLLKDFSTTLYSSKNSKELSVPWSISADDDGIVFVSDLAKARVLRIDGKSVSEVINSSVLSDNNIDADGLVFYKINKSGDKLVLSSGSSIYVYSVNDKKIETLDSVRYSFISIAFRFVVYSALMVFIVSLFIILSFLYKEVFHSKIPSMVSRSIVLIFAIGVSTFLVTMFILKNFSERYTRTITERSSQMVQLIPKAIDGDLISKIDTQEKFMNEDYRKIRSSLVSLFNNNKDPWNDRYYYAVYRVMNDSLYGFMYLNDGISTFHPFDYFADPESSYRKAYSGEIISETDTDSWGSWIYALGPIKNSKGEVVAVLEVGTDLYSFDRENMRLVKKVVIDVITLLVVFILLLIEFTYLGQLSAKRSLAKKTDKDYSDTFFSRPVFFMYSFGISMSVAFIPILMKKIYVPVFGMPQDVVIALAFSVEALFFALFLFAGGIIVEKLNWRNLKYIGLALSMSGLFLCGFTSDMFVFLAARGIVGAGSGLILIACRSFINSEQNSEKRSVAYSHFYSGGIAGVNTGAVFGAFFADQFGFSFAFYLAVSILLIALLISVSIFKNMKIKALPPSEEHLMRSVLRFISNRKVMFYLILAVLPTYAAGMFLSYYVPLFSESHGLSVTDTGRLIILNGLFIIYLGPLLTRFFKRRMSDRNALILGSFGWAISLGIYAATGSIGGVVAALVLMGIVEGFCVSAQNDYFMNLPIVKKIGSDRSVSYMELASRGAEMCAPVIFAYVLTIGERSGIALFAGGVIFMTIVFTISSRESGIRKSKGRV